MTFIRKDTSHFNRRGEFCHELLSGSGVCAPKGRICSEYVQCPNIGSTFEGQVQGRCGDLGICEWEVVEIIV